MALIYFTQVSFYEIENRKHIPLDLRDIGFDKRPPYTRWIPYGMPQLGQYKWIMDIVFFLYPSEEDARNGTEYGGTGFLVAVPSKRWPKEYYHIHGVSNWHVVAGDTGAATIRLNRRDDPSKPDVLGFDPSEWTFGGLKTPDIAISLPLELDPSVHKVEAIGLDAFLTQESEANADINAADDVFMIGRFVDYDGVETNVPSFRFGNISIIDAKIKQERGYKGRSIVVDMHSRTGYSGSPVFVYRTPGSVFAPNLDLLTSWHFIRFLGIHWGQFPEEWELKTIDKQAMASASMITDGKYVQGLSGMSCAIPAADIIGLLNHPELEVKREAVELQLSSVMFRKCVRPLPMIAGGPPGFENQIGAPVREELENEMRKQAIAMNLGGI